MALGAALAPTTLSCALGEGERQAGGEAGPAAIPLPPAVHKGTLSVEEALLARRSQRAYGESPLGLSELSQLLWAAQGITDEATRFRAAPSAGALYPLEVYVAAGKVTGLPAGVYKYRPTGHELARGREGDVRGDLCNAALGQRAVAEAPAVLVFAAVYERTQGKYGERAARYVHLEAGHAAQNVYLQAAALGLGTVAMGAFVDEAVRGIVGLADGERPLYLMPVGKV